MPESTLDGPIAGRAVIDLASYDLASIGYVAQEWFLHGSATSYEAGSGLSPDGRWEARPAAGADFVTRLVVVRPIDDARFDGTVVLEWLNVSSGEDIAAEWLYTHRHLTRSGSAWVGVSVQSAGIAGGGFLRGRHLLRTDPDRYHRLQHPGDGYAFDIFTQAAAAVRRPDGPLGGLRATTLLGAGASQSAMYLVTYLNAIDPLVQVFDGFLLHGRGVRGAWMQGGLLDPQRFVTDLIRYGRPALPGHRIRTDVRVPVMIVQSETDVVLLGSGLARTPWVSAPVATLSGLGQTVVGMGLLLGSTRAWSTDALARRYPDGKSHYVDEFVTATRDAIRSGFILAADEAEITALGAVCWPPDCPADTAVLQVPPVMISRSH